MAPADILSVAAWISIPFSSPAQVVAGKQYAIVLTAPGGGTSYTAHGEATDAYPAGQRCSSTGSPPTWSVATPGDLAFKTYVAVPNTPISTTTPTSAPAPTGLQAAALRKCKKKAQLLPV